MTITYYLPEAHLAELKLTTVLSRTGFTISKPKTILCKIKSSK